MSHGMGLSQINNNKESLFHLSLFPPASSNGNQASLFSDTASFNILAGLSSDEKAFTFGGLANIIVHDATGFQFAGLYNYVGNDGRGLLFSGLVNTVRDNYKGVQFAGIINTVKDIDGLQFSCIANKTENVKGLQFAGIINISKKVSGVQASCMINIADSCDYPIGIMNFIGNGEKSISVSYNEIGSLLISFRSGGRITYGILGIGINANVDKSTFVVEGGLGAHLRLSDCFVINAEAKSENIGFNSNNTYKAGLYILPAYRISKHFEISAGPGINYMKSNDTDNRDLFPGKSLWKKFDYSQLQQSNLGYEAEIHFVF